MTSVQKDPQQIQNIGNLLLDVNRPLKERFRALFTLRNIGDELSIRCIEKCFADSSALLKHECAYCLGQMQNPLAVPKLESILKDSTEVPIVRHEAAEALAAIGSISSLPLLKQFASDPSIEVAETCQLAVQKLEEMQNLPGSLPENPYRSVDPALPFPKGCYDSIIDLQTILLNEKEPLYKRYRAMFSLRNMATSESAVALSKGLQCGSDLFRHEVAYVLGQMQDPATVKALTKVLMDNKCHEMVRHECAEALGAIATDECMQILKMYAEDNKRVVRESCEVALDMCDYENSREFQYANALVNEALWANGK